MAIGLVDMEEWRDIPGYEGERQKDLAKEYGVSQHAIYRIKAGDNWSWLTGLSKEGN